MKIAAYIRVSSKGQDLALQRDAIQRASKERGEVVAEWHEEKVSGRKLSRPVLDKLRSQVRDGLVSKIYVFKLDRLTRSGVADTYRIVDEFRKAGCALVAVADNLTIRPGGDDIVSETLIFALALAARLERAAINDRITAARTRIESEGGAWGRPKRLSAADCERLKTLSKQGRSIRAVSVALKIPRSTVARYLAAKDD